MVGGDRLDELREHIGAVDEHGRSPTVAPVLHELRELLNLEQAGVFRFSRLDERAVLDDVQIAGSPLPQPEVHTLAGEHFRRSRVWALYDPLAPEPEQRNKAMVVETSLDSLAAGATTKAKREARARAQLGLRENELKQRLAAFEETERRMLAPMGWARRKQLRVLVCDGPELLGWVGGTGHELGARQARTLQALVPAFKRRLGIARRLEAGAVARVGLAAALDALGAPAFIMDAKGAVHHANELGALVLQSSDARARVVASVRGEGSMPGLEITPIASPSMATMKLRLVILRKARDAKARLDVVASRWKLTVRETEVLRELVEGEPNKIIASRLGCAEATIEIHVTRILEKSCARSRVDVAIRFWRDA